MKGEHLAATFLQNYQKHSEVDAARMIIRVLNANAESPDTKTTKVLYHMFDKLRTVAKERGFDPDQFIQSVDSTFQYAKAIDDRPSIDRTKRNAGRLKSPEEQGKYLGAAIARAYSQGTEKQKIFAAVEFMAEKVRSGSDEETQRLVDACFNAITSEINNQEQLRYIDGLFRYYAERS